MVDTDYSAVAHQYHLFCCPLTELKADQLVGVLDLPENSTILDVGCSKGELLIRIIERYGARGIGIDSNPYFLKEGRDWAKERIPNADIKLIEGDASKLAIGGVDLALCIGSTHIYGGIIDTLKVLKSIVKPGGHILVGDVYWKVNPAPEYLQAIGVRVEEYYDHIGNIRVGIAHGMNPEFVTTASNDDWDAYEGLHHRAMQQYAASRPQDFNAAKAALNSRHWYQTYLCWGRETMGFGFYLFRR